MAMIKSNAYGHGLALIAKLLAKRQETSDKRQGVSRVWFGVDSITEAVRLRKEKITNPILVLGYTLPRRLKEAAQENITITISHFEGLRELAKLKKRPRFHIKIDSGMHRQGFQLADMPRLIGVLKKNRLVPEGIYSHLAMPQNAAFSQKQIGIFKKCLALLRDNGIAPQYIHFNKTEGIVRFPQSCFNMVRLGIGLYGYYPGRKLPIRPVLAWKTIVAEVKDVKKRECVSYDLTERLRRDSVIAILPIGYWHGFDRSLSSIGEVLIHGKRAKVLGRVTMDMTMVDVTDINHGVSKMKVKIGDEVVLVGRQGREYISADEVADKIGTTAYEVLTRINPLIYKVSV